MFKLGYIGVTSDITKFLSLLINESDSMNKVKILFYIKEVSRPIVMTYSSKDSEESIQKTISKIIENNKVFELRSNVTNDIIIFRSEDIRCVFVTKAGDSNESDNITNNK